MYAATASCFKSICAVRPLTNPQKVSHKEPLVGMTSIWQGQNLNENQSNSTLSIPLYNDIQNFTSPHCEKNVMKI